MDQSVAAKSSFDQPKHSMAFINRCCDHTPSTENQSAQSQAQQDPAQHAKHAQHGSHQLPDLTGDAHGEHFPGLLAAKLSPSADAEGATVQLPGFEDSNFNSNSNLNPNDPARPQGSKAALQGKQKEAKDAASPSVHYFMMGSDHDRGWKACHSWPLPNASRPPLKLYLNKAAEPARKSSRSWLRLGKKSAKVANTEPATATEPLHQPLGLHNRQHASGQASTSGSQNQHASAGNVTASGLPQPQQPAGQQTSNADVNPKPVPAQQGHMPVAQVVASKKRPQLGLLTQPAAQQNCRFRHDIDLDKQIKVIPFRLSNTKQREWRMHSQCCTFGITTRTKDAKSPALLPLHASSVNKATVLATLQCCCT